MPRLTEKEKIKRLVNKLKSRPIKRLADIRKLGIKAWKIDKGNGAYRVVYKVSGLPVVVKLPARFETDKEHSRQEYKMYKKLKKNFKQIRKYLPVIYYCNEKTGMVVMRYYKLLKTPPYHEYDNKEHPAWQDKEARYALADHLEKLYSGASDVSNSGNVARDTDGQLKVIDLGCFV